MTGQVTIIRETRLDPDFPLSRQELKELCSVIMDALDLPDDSFEIKLVDDGEIARLNREFMGCQGPTNVLSFPAYDEENGTLESDEPVHLGSLALSVDALAREAALYGQPSVAHLARLLAHGILHLAGYDHGEEMYDLTDTAVDRVLLEYGIAVHGVMDAES